ncbi:hypothetical protein ABAC460_23710 [Asticcacaulis sp. AC460]|uniref:beta strand repeat-containing protein n=1 Tax=Asticcacaulis sp. AC460 TaxID=1282360 RepID=UPI0003C3D1DE|nr:calcium-binding protein [Asticcacaulis sp. AC460]ESQ85366.1 hypothetical protein ABAC460_23710 [Asticcacaulis sp. AC460]
MNHTWQDEFDEQDVIKPLVLREDSADAAITSGADDNLLTVNYAEGEFTWSAGIGEDTLVIDASAVSDVILMHTSSGGSFYSAPWIEKLNGGGAQSNFYGVEHLVVYGGNSGDVLSDLAGTDSLFGGGGGDSLFSIAGVDVLDGGEGFDSAYVSRSQSALNFFADLAQAETASGIILTDGTVVKNAEYVSLLTGSGADTVLGGSEQSDIYAGGGNDSISGGTGYVQIWGDDGNDTIHGGTNGGNLYGGIGNDLIYAGIGPDAIEAEEGNDTVIGNGNLTTVHQLGGGEGDDVLYGGGGWSSLGGHEGNDTYYIDNLSQTINDGLNSGKDVVYSSVSFTLNNDLEDLILTGSSNLNGTGGSLANKITGNAGNNSLNGGSGADTLTGGLGDDTYLIDNVGDKIVESSGQGTDTVASAMSFSLSGKQLENLTLTGSAALTATGNSLANVLAGNSGNNTLDAGAGNDHLDGKSGADTMIGGSGNDTYIVDSSNDAITEFAGGGADFVNASVTYSLSADLEVVILTGSAAVNATGNAGNNTLTGNAGNNILTGGLGNDTYYVQNIGDNVVELAGEGKDQIFSTATYTLYGRVVENLTLTGTSAANATGNSLSNALTGNDGANIINGMGNKDVLTGGLGADIFLFTAGSGLDTITDFSIAQNDTININAYTGGAMTPAMVSQTGLNVVITLSSGNAITVNGAIQADVLAQIVW